MMNKSENGKKRAKLSPLPAVLRFVLCFRRCDTAVGTSRPAFYREHRRAARKRDGWTSGWPFCGAGAGWGLFGALAPLLSAVDGRPRDFRDGQSREVLATAAPVFAREFARDVARDFFKANLTKGKVA